MKYTNEQLEDMLKAMCREVHENLDTYAMRDIRFEFTRQGWRYYQSIIDEIDTEIKMDKLRHELSECNDREIAIRNALIELGNEGK